ncbi:hypothetical protein O181_037944 [Austropuccinia psidii MF-1]|uniref:Uncharacterized protein n=1 Tax=Austropuccinia psidii MF-1 TaxID=1389203 RepID=A0A9Q3D7D7_9BASI|nr:hypothetical protein [Austropuccinia psidii MF-1]
MGDAIREHSDDDQDPKEEFLVECQEETQLKIQDVYGAHCSIVDREYLDNHFPHLEKKLFPTKAKNVKISSEKMTSIGTIIKDIIMPHRKRNIRLHPEFLMLEDAHIKGYLLVTDNQRMYCIDIYNSKNTHITIGTNKERKFSLDTYHMSIQDPLEELLNKFKELQLSANRIKPLGKIRGHDIEIYMDVERPYPPMLRRPLYPAGLETRKEIERHINEILDIDVIRTIGKNEIVEITTPFLITLYDGISRFCGDFRALNNYTKAARYPVPGIPHPRKAFTSQINNQNGLYESLSPEWS